MLNKYLILIISISIFSFRLEANLMQQEVEHVVVLMLENRSFDNVLAWLYSQKDTPPHIIPSNSDPRYQGLTEETLSLYTNTLTDSSGTVVFSTPPIKGIPSVASTVFLNSPQIDPNETFPHVLNQMGSQYTMNGFLQDYALLWWEHEWQSQKQNICAVMETYTDEELPIFYSLAKHYAVSDFWFASVPTQTNPNRAFAACGTSEGQLVNGPFAKSLFYSDTIWNRLSELSPNTSWMIFWQTDMIPVLFPGPFTGTNTFASMNNISDLENHYLKIDGFHELARKGQLPNFSFIEPQMTTSINLDPKVKLLDEINETKSSLMLGLQGNDLHPPGDVRSTENLLANIYTSLIANQEAWNKTLFILTFDEHGGLFDHVSPPAAIPPDSYNQNGFNFDRYGVRVPAIFISPRIEKGTVVRSTDPKTPFDHTSLISTILTWNKIPIESWNMGKRVSAAPTFDSVITLSTPRTDCVLSDAPIPEAKNVIQFGDGFYLKDRKGNYLAQGTSWFTHLARVGSPDDKVSLQFTGGSGTLTHGSFVLIQSNDSSLGQSNLLETLLGDVGCLYSTNKHMPGQWWTVKSVDSPYVGCPIQHGDRIYLENHIYLDLFQYVPGRLSTNDGLFSRFLNVIPITSSGSDDLYWTIERIPKSG